MKAAASEEPPMNEHLRRRPPGFGRCDRCRQKKDRGFIPGTHWLVCLQCYNAWRTWQGLP
jgi:hypothetical protein